MSTPIWMAAPPEMHSALLSSGPGPGPLLAAAGAWHSLSIVYAETADELTAVLAAVQAGTWDGPTGAAYVAAHLPYLAWLVQASADSAAIAVQQETTAIAYTTALATMPTLAELAVNHTTHTVLTVTNFFGINTIPIALNEADYMRMWIQAATVMGTYQTVASTALALAPQTPPAPEIVQSNALAAASNGLLLQPQDWQQWITQFLQDIGYTAFYNNVIQPLINWIANIPFLQTLFAFDPYLLILGNPLTYLSPLNIAFALGYPMDIATYVALLSETFAFIAADLAAAFASGNPTTIAFAILFATVEAVGTIITDTIALLKTLLEQTLILLPAVLSLLAVPLAPLATGAVLVPIGAKGLAALVAVPPALPVPAATPALAALAPNVPTPPSPAPSPSPAPAPATAPAPTPGPPPSATAPPGVTNAGMPSYGYLVSGLDATAKRAAGAGARRKAAEPDSAAAPAEAATAQALAATQRRKRAKVKKIGRGYEYADLDPNELPAEPRPTSVAAASHSAETLGFADSGHKTGAGHAAGLITLAGDAFDGGACTPVMPSTWGADSAPTPSDPADDG